MAAAAAPGFEHMGLDGRLLRVRGAGERDTGVRAPGAEGPGSGTRECGYPGLRCGGGGTLRERAWT